MERPDEQTFEFQLKSGKVATAYVEIDTDNEAAWPLEDIENHLTFIAKTEIMPDGEPVVLLLGQVFTRTYYIVRKSDVAIEKGYAVVYHCNEVLIRDPMPMTSPICPTCFKRAKHMKWDKVTGVQVV